MNAVPPSLTPGTTGGRWAALHDAAAIVAALADMELPDADVATAGLVADLAEGPSWRRELFERSALDAVAALQPGIAGLGAMAARGIDPRPAARALWDEFVRARDALLLLAAQDESAPREA